ncbi:MAG TPA: hypothetical protein VGH43_14085 [Jatrophihabitans sp.]|jgi:hypothetical protein
MRTTPVAGRHQVGRQGRRLTAPSTWIAILAAVIAVAAVALGMAPAQASTTVEVQLTLSGVASPDNPTGGATVGVHPGDSVVMHASAIPTAGAPGGLSDPLRGLVAGVAGLQVKIQSGNLPGVHYPVVLGKVPNCGGTDKLLLRSLAKGTYSFKYVVQKISLVTSVLGAVTGCNKATVTPTHDQLGALTQNNVKVTDNAVYSGSIVVADNPPAGKIGVQLPSQSVSVKAGPVHTSVNLPGATVGVPNPIPSITKGLPKPPGLPGSGGGKSGSKGGSSGNVNYTPPAVTVPEKVMPHAVNMGGGGQRYVAPGAGNAGAIGGHIVAPPEKATATAQPVTHPSDVANAAANKKPVDLSQGSDTGQQLPVILAVLAILALSVVTAGYARMVLLKRH